jgi:flagellar assembly protein FliH
MTPYKSWNPPSIVGGSTAVARPPQVDPIQAAYARGLAEGRAEGSAAAEQRLRAARKAVEGMAHATAEARDALAGEIEQTVAVLALAIAQRMVARELQADPEEIAELVRRTVATLPPSGPPTVRINPDDLAALESAGPSVADSNRTVDVEWIADAAVESGGFVVETPQRVLDARLTSVFRDLYERLRDA